MNIYSRLDVCNLPIWQEISAANLTWSESKGSVLPEIQKFLNQTTSIYPHYLLVPSQISTLSVFIIYIFDAILSLIWASIFLVLHRCMFHIAISYGKIFSDHSNCGMLSLNFILHLNRSFFNNAPWPISLIWTSHSIACVLPLQMTPRWNISNSFLSITWQYCTASQVLPC